jgi:hypothetical protein
VPCASLEYLPWPIRSPMPQPSAIAAAPPAPAPAGEGARSSVLLEYLWVRIALRQCAVCIASAPLGDFSTRFGHPYRLSPPSRVTNCTVGRSSGSDSKRFGRSGKAKGSRSREAGGCLGASSAAFGAAVWCVPWHFSPTGFCGRAASLLARAVQRLVERSWTQVEAFGGQIGKMWYIFAARLPIPLDPDAAAPTWPLGPVSACERIWFQPLSPVAHANRLQAAFTSRSCALPISC